jgi:hypothetical protein
MDPEGRRTILCDKNPTFVLYRIAEELGRRGAIKPLLGLGCSPLLVSGTKRLFLKWIGRALRQKRIQFPEGNGPVRWSLSSSFFRVSETNVDDGNRHETAEESPAILAEQEVTA